MILFTMIRDGMRFVFEEAGDGQYIEYMQVWEEGKDGAPGEWITQHTVSFLPKDVAKTFCAKLSTIGFAHAE